MRKSTAAQIAASRRNGARSRGPLTDQTRAKSALNALKHGLTSSTILLDDENPDRFQDLLNDLLADLCPQSSLEFCAIEEMATAKWKQRRAWQLETNALNEAAAECHAPGSRPLQAWRKLHHRRNHDFQNILLRQTRLDHEFDRALRRFRALEAMRPEQLTEETPNGKIEPGN